MKSEVLRCWTCTQLGCTCANVLEEVLPKVLTPLVHFHRWKKMLQIILSLIGLSVCLIALCSSLIGLCACLISLSQKKPISTGLFWEKLVEKCKVVPDYVHFFPKLPIRFATHLRSHFSPWSLTLPTQPCSKNALQIALWLFFPSWTATHLDLGTWWLIRCYGASPCFYNPT